MAVYYQIELNCVTATPNPNVLIKGNTCSTDSRSCMHGECNGRITKGFEKEKINYKTSSEESADKTHKKSI